MLFRWKTNLCTVSYSHICHGHRHGHIFEDHCVGGLKVYTNIEN